MSTVHLPEFTPSQVQAMLQIAVFALGFAVVYVIELEARHQSRRGRADEIRRQLQADEIRRQIARCEREIDAMQEQPPTQPAYLTTLGIEDWKRERQMLERELINVDKGAL